MTTPGACDHLAIDLIRRKLDTSVVGRHVYLFESVTSTNDALRHFARAGAEEGTVVLAEQQTAGRRHGNLPWFSPPGVNLYASVLFRPALGARDVPLFALIASLALADAARAEGAPAATRWPNDVVVDGRKLGGALVEYATVGDRVTHVILGVGVNLNVDEADLRAALAEEAGGATTLTRVLGRGGMGAVYHAREVALDWEVAVKVLQDQFVPGSATAARFVEEAKITGQLQHPGIPAVYQVGQFPDGRPFLAMLG